MGVLDELKKEAEQVLREQDSDQLRQAALDRVFKDELVPRLQRIYSYLRDLVQQLETVTWKVEAEYFFPGIVKAQLLLQEDYRVHVDSTDRPTRVSLSFTCRQPLPQQYVVAKQHADALRDFLFAQEASYSTRPFSSPTGEHQFLIETRLQVKAQIIFEADISNSEIDVHIVNFEEDTVVDIDLPYTEIDEERLDRLGNFVLRRINEFSKKHYLDETEQEALREHLKQAKTRERHGISRADFRNSEAAPAGWKNPIKKLRGLLSGNK